MQLRGAPRAARIALVACTLVLCALALGASAQAQTANELLRGRPFAPNDRGLFSNLYYPDTPADVPATGTTLTEQQGRAALQSYLQVEYPGDTTAQNAALAVYDNTTAKQKIPEPSLRAALAALKGTIANGAVNVVLNAKTSMGNPLIARVRYGGLPTTVIARTSFSVFTPGDDEQFEIIFNRRFQYESPFLFTSVWAHETLHSDKVGALYEEAANTSFQGLIYLRQLARHPALATPGTELARVSNSWALARLNSGLGSRLGLYKTNGGRPLFVGSPSVPETSWLDWLEQRIYAGFAHTATPGNALLGQYLANTHIPGAPTCSGAQFSKPLLDCIDANGNGGLSPAELVAAARALKLKVVGSGGDTKAPETSITDHPKRTVRTRRRKARVRFEFRSSEANSSFECKLDREAFKDCSSPYKRRVKAGRGRGRKHTFKVRATDAAHNTDPTPATFEFRVKRVG